MGPYGLTLRPQSSQPTPRPLKLTGPNLVYLCTSATPSAQLHYQRAPGGCPGLPLASCRRQGDGNGHRASGLPFSTSFIWVANLRLLRPWCTAGDSRSLDRHVKTGGKAARFGPRTATYALAGAPLVLLVLGTVAWGVSCAARLALALISPGWSHPHSFSTEYIACPLCCPSTSMPVMPKLTVPGCSGGHAMCMGS